MSTFTVYVYLLNDTRKPGKETGWLFEDHIHRNSIYNEPLSNSYGYVREYPSEINYPKISLINSFESCHSRFNSKEEAEEYGKKLVDVFKKYDLVFRVVEMEYIYRDYSKERDYWPDDYTDKYGNQLDPNPLYKTLYVSEWKPKEPPLDKKT